MVHNSKLDNDLSEALNWIEQKVILDPEGRINNFTGKRKPNGAQHTIHRTDRVFSFLYDRINTIAKESFRNYIISDVWTNINLPKGFNKKHNHTGVDIAGCFYLKVPENSGDIEFETGERFTPSAGDIFWWDASITHWVHENESDEVRYSIAFNIKKLDHV